MSPALAIMKHFVIVITLCLLAAASSYCGEGSTLSSDLVIAPTNVTPQTAIGCILGANVTLSLSGVDIPTSASLGVVEMTFVRGRVSSGGFINVAGSKINSSNRVPLVVLISNNSFGNGAAVLLTGSFPPDSNITISFNAFVSATPCSLMTWIVKSSFVTVIAIVDVGSMGLYERAAVNVQYNNISTSSGANTNSLSVPIVVNAIAFHANSSVRIKGNTVRSHGTSTENTWAIYFDYQHFIVNSTTGAALRYYEGGGRWEFEDNWIQVTADNDNSNAAVYIANSPMIAAQSGTFSISRNHFVVIPQATVDGTNVYGGSAGNYGTNFNYLIVNNTFEMHNIGNFMATMGIELRGSSSMVFSDNRFISANANAGFYVKFSSLKLQDTSQLMMANNRFIATAGASTRYNALQFSSYFELSDSSSFIFSGNSMDAATRDTTYKLITMSSLPSITQNAFITACDNWYYGQRLGPFSFKDAVDAYFSSLPILHCKVTQTVSSTTAFSSSASPLKIKTSSNTLQDTTLTMLSTSTRSIPLTMSQTGHATLTPLPITNSSFLTKSQTLSKLGKTNSSTAKTGSITESRLSLSTISASLVTSASTSTTDSKMPIFTVTHHKSHTCSLPIIRKSSTMILIPVPVPPSLTAGIAIAASAIGAMASAVDAQTIAVVGLVACAQKGEGERVKRDLRALSIVAIDNTCEGVLIGNTIVVAAVGFLSAVGVAVSRIVLVRRSSLARRHHLWGKVDTSLKNACAMARAPHLWLMVCIYLMNSYSVCGIELARDMSRTKVSQSVGLAAAFFPLALVISFPAIVFLLGARRLFSVRYTWKPKVLREMGSIVFQKWEQDPSLAPCKLFDCIMGGYRRLGCLWSLIDHTSFLANLPLILANHNSGTCGPLFSLSASISIAGSFVVLVARPRRILASDLLHGATLLVNGMIVAYAAALIYFPLKASSFAALEQLGMAITVLTVVKVVHILSTIMLTLLSQYGFVGGIEIGHDGTESPNNISVGCMPSSLSYEVSKLEYSGLWWQLDVPCPALPLCQVSFVETEMTNSLLPVTTNTKIAADVEIDQQNATTTNSFAPFSSNRAVIATAERNNNSYLRYIDFDEDDVERYFTPDQQFRHEIARDCARRQLQDLLR